ncbi:MAG: hypothetical protein GQ578_04410 [Desulfuromonadaceae bacterium]|nr:hypothetical protein [Desulfuromonadaceae bacterium]
MKPLEEMSMGELAAYVCSHLKTHGIDVVLSGGGCHSIAAENMSPSIWILSRGCRWVAED